MEAWGSKRPFLTRRLFGITREVKCSVSKAMKRIAFFLAVTIAGILLALSPPARGQDQKEKEWTGKWKDGRIITKEDLAKILEEHDKWGESDDKEGQRADLGYATLMGADLSGANLSVVNLTWANLRGANLRWANLTGADLENADASFGDFTISLFQPKNIEGFVFLGAKGLSTVVFDNFDAVAELRKIAKESGLRSEERALTAALRKYRIRAAQFHEWIFEYIFLDLPTDSGANPWRSLATLFLLIPIFSIFYMIVLENPWKDGIWQVWIPERVRKDLGEKKPVRLTLRGNAAQSLISVYLAALWVLTYFGRPFE